MVRAGRGNMTSPVANAEFVAVRCSACRRLAKVDDCITVSRGKSTAFTVCSRCASWFEFALKPTDAGIEVQAKLARTRP